MATPKRERADRLLQLQGLATSRSQAQALLLAGRVYAGERRIDKAGTLLETSTQLTLRGGTRFVSRGGLKLEGALETLGFDVRGLVAADVGASTGGFTDCLLQRGARQVFAIDVGHGQLAQGLREDPRVVVMERTNARHLTADSLGSTIDLCVVDASFISLEKLLGALAAILRPGGHLLALVKPQFEVGRREASRARGVIRDESLRLEAIGRTVAAVREHGFTLLGECESSIKGPKGNLEHFVLAARNIPKRPP
jgi:23S rRNA (cytidine1920-2'-O)/16S rRNA (cytidine1409-2'-O)-methyltransferase